MITGHTHRGGPREDEAEWALPGGGRLHNTGSWVFADAFHHPGTPARALLAGNRHLGRGRGAAAPRALLLDRPREELLARERSASRGLGGDV